MKRETAEGLNELIQTYNRKLSAYLPELKAELGEVEVKAITRPVSQMLALSFDVLDIVWKEYPDLRPEHVKD